MTALAETHPFTVHDLLAMNRVGAPVASPDGHTVVFGVDRTDLAHNKRVSGLWLVGSDGSGLRRLTGDSGAGQPRWSPDGRTVYFLASRGGSAQVWRIAVDGGEAGVVTHAPLDVRAFALSPDGSQLLIAMDVVPGTSLAETKRRLDEAATREKDGPTGRVYDRLFVRHWDDWADGRRSHLFIVPVDGGEPRDLMPAMDADAPSKPDGGPAEFTFSRDGATVVFTARDAGASEAWSTNFDLWAVPADGSAPPRNLTADNLAWDTSPAFSPDGRTLAYLAMKTPGYEADRLRIVLRAWPEGPSRVLTEAWDRSAHVLAWSSDGRTLYTTADDHGQTALFAIDVASGDVRTVVGQGTVSGVTVAGERLVYALAHLQSPAELYSVRPDGGDVRVVTHINAAQLAAARMGTPEPFRFAGAHGDSVRGCIVKPVDFDPAQKYPVVMIVHGGPQGSFLNLFHYRWNAQAYAGAGYAVVLVDFHGSTGYGQAFCDAIQHDWGGAPLEDLQKGLAAALAANPWMDGERAAAVGASYGGWMMNWIAGRWPDRFRCLVNHDGFFDNRSAYYETEELWFPERDLGATPWENPQGYAAQNPADFVASWKTPMLVIHGGRDYRIPETQGLATFTTLQRRGIPSRLLHFPDENHFVLKPRNSLLWHETVLAWLDRWTKPKAAAR